MIKFTSFRKGLLSLFILLSGIFMNAQITPDANGIVYVKTNGSGNGSDWDHATNDLHNAIHVEGVEKVFVAVGNYNVGANSFIMKNGVAIYGGFDPSGGITTLEHNRIMPNTSNTNGSILYGQNARPVIWNVFTSATALNSTAILDGFTIMGGSYSNGAGIRNVYASPTLRNLVIRDNNASLSGAGIYNDNSSPAIINSVINGNSINSAFAQSGIGAGIYNGTNSAPTLINTTITDNRITGIGAAPVMVGAGVANLNGAAPEIYNSIIWNNKKNNEAAASGADIENINAGITLKNSITQSYSTENGDDNNLVGVNPLFADNSFTIPMTSPAVNAGNNSYLSPYGGTGGTDLAGNPRLSSQSVDIGAYEYQLNITPTDGIVYVKETGTGNGSSWEDATGWLHDAIHTNGVQKVFVAIGNYNVSDNSFIMKNNVEIYGGFDPDNNIKTLDDNRILPNQTAQEGSVLNGQNTRPIIWNVFTSGTAMDSTAVLDGFTLKNGYTSVSDGGGGISNKYASPTLRNLVIKNNESYFSGGGITNKYNSSPNLTNVIIKNNTAITGGGMYNYLYSNPILNNVDFIENQASSGGGFSNGYGSYLVYTNGTVQGNNAQNSGGGIEHYNWNEQDVLMLTNVSVTGNTSGGSGGGIWSYGHLVCNKVIIKGNSSEYYGGGIYQLGEHLTLEQVLIANNETDEDGGGGLYLEGSSSYVYDFKSSTIVNNQPQAIYSYNSEPVPVISNSIIVGDIEGGITYNAQSSFVNDPNLTTEDLFTNPAAEDYTLKTTSPAIDSGNDTLFIGLDSNTTDLAGNPRLLGSSIDRGAYEYVSPFTDGIIYVKENGTGNGTSWEHATGDLHNAIHTVEVQKVFVAIGNYNVGDHSFIMKNGVEIYGGFDPDNNIKTLDDERILPNRGTAEGSILNGQNVRPVIWNVFTSGTALNTSAVLDGFTVMNGLGDVDGGGIRNIYASPALRNLVIKNNSLSSAFTTKGGGIYNQDFSSPVITNVIIKGNSGKLGGGFASWDSTCEPVLTNVLIAGNIGIGPSAPYGGVLEQGKAKYTNVTIAGNTGNQLYVNNSNTQLNNVIVLGENSNGISAGGIHNSLISGFTDTSNGNLDSTGITTEDIFTNPSASDYTLKNGSIAVNAGSNALFAGLDENTTDLAGNERVYNYANGGVIDMGAYESFYTRLIPDANNIIYVKENAAGNADGSSWDDATDDLHNAINATGVQKVFVAVGHYNTGDSSFVMKNNVEIYGGFDPDNGIEDLNDNRILPTETIGGSVLDGENTKTVILNDFTIDNPLNNTAVLDGFTLTKGHNVPGRGAAIYNYYASPVLANLVIKNSEASYGGAMYNEYSSPVVTNTSLLNNKAYAGGGIFNNESSVAFSNITISGNTAYGDGGAIYNDLSSLVFVNIKITGNTGAASSVVLNTDSDVTFINAEITGNHTVDYNSSADIYNSSGGNMLFLNSTFAYNNSVKTFSNTSFNGEIQVKNSIVFDAIDDWDEFTAEYSFIQDNEDDSNGNIVLDIDEGDVFTDPDNGDFTLKINSPVINLGNNALYSGLDENTLDLAGNPRLFGTNIDLGAYESDFIPASEHCLYATIWNGTSWSNGEPDYDTQAIIDGDLVISYELDACEVVVTPNGSLRILAEAVLYSDWSVTNLATADGLVIENNGALIQWEEIENNGAVTVMRESNPMIRLDYTLWSSPVIGQNLFNFSPETINGVTNYPGSTGRIYVYEGANGYVNPDPFEADTEMNSGTGYLFRSPNNFNSTVPAVYNGIFTGVPFNGSLTVPTTAENYTSVGNPYPSAIDTYNFILENPGITTLYFWNNNHSSGNNYATCTLGNCVAAAAGGIVPNGIISTGQGFIVATSGTSVNFNNSMRTNDNSNFFKVDETEKHRFWLNLSNDENQGYNQVLVGYMTGATNNIDNQIDGKLFGYEGSALYSIIGEEKFVIQGRALPFETSDVVPLGFRAAEAGTFTISLANLDGLFAEGEVTIYLKDRQAHTIHNLMESDYVFESAEGEFKERFEVVYGTDEIMGTGDLNSSLVQIYKHNKNIVVSSQSEKILSVELYDLQGRNIHRNDKVNANHYQIRSEAKGVLVVKVQTQNGEVVTKKVINK